VAVNGGQAGSSTSCTTIGMLLQVAWAAGFQHAICSESCACMMQHSPWGCVTGQQVPDAAFFRDVVHKH
jgi:hypothetical protein